MPAPDPLTPDPDDPFGPSAVPTEVGCLHCGSTYDSFRIEWRIEPDRHGTPRGWWCCPMPGCDGRGFGCDLLPTDPDYQDENGGWVYCPEDESDPDDTDLDLPPGADDDIPF